MASHSKHVQPTRVAKEQLHYAVSSVSAEANQHCCIQELLVQFKETRSGKFCLQFWPWKQAGFSLVIAVGPMC